MNKKLLVFIIFLFIFKIYAQTTDVPDENFEYYLETHDSSGGVVSIGDPSSMGDGVDNNHLVTTSNISSVTSLYIDERGFTNLTGIEDFTSLSVLYCNSNSLTSLDLSNNTSLTVLHCSYNNLASLLLPSTTTLTDVWCNNNNLTALDVTNNPNLIWLAIFNNSIGSINLNNNTQLQYLRAQFNDLTTLNTSQNVDLVEISAYDNLLESVDVTQNAQLAILKLGNNSLTSIDVTQNTLLTILHTFNNNLTEIDVSTLTDLEQFQTHSNPLTFLDVSNNSKLTLFACIDTLVDGINMQSGGNTLLTGANCYINQNPNLYCIQVDDAAWSTSNWWQRDGWVSFSENCSYLGITENALNKIQIYPNPSKDKFYIDLQLEANYTLTNIFGQQVQKGALISGTNELSIQLLSNGLYFLNIETAEGKATKKIIKQ